MYPDKYYIYKYELFRDAAAELNSEYRPKRNGSIDILIGGLGLPDITVAEWVEMLNDTSVFTLNALQIMKRMKDYGGQATYTQLSIKYGESKNFYNSGSTALARRVAEKTGCEVMTKDNDNAKWWPILYMGKDASASESGSYIWRLRSELAKALDMVDLSEVPLYVDAAPAI